jgi:site-specific DNA-methyltransferase (adenine-specific)/modification methylase
MATLYLGDAHEVLSEIARADAIVTDPPYGMDRANSGHKVVARLGAVHGDDAPFDPRPFLIAQHHIFWGANHYASRLPDATRWLAWLKHDPGLFGSRSTSPVELAWTDLGGSLRALKLIWDGSIKQGVGAGAPHQHPTEKPVEVMAWCLSLLPKDVALVCDPFMGSGTTGVACMAACMPFIGIEIDPAHFETACRRMDIANRLSRFEISEQEAKRLNRRPESEPLTDGLFGDRSMTPPAQRGTARHPKIPAEET